MIPKTEALKLIGNLAEAAKVHVMAANGFSRAKTAPYRELKAARKVFEKLTTDGATDDEIGNALGW